MHTLQGPAGWLAPLFLLAVPVAAAEPGPLRWVPDQVELVFQVDQPRQLVQAVLDLRPVRELEQFQAFRELLRSTSYRRFYQLVDYFEAQLGAKWPELLDRLSGQGAALAVKLGTNPAPAVLIIEGKDASLLRRFQEVLVNLAEQELAREDSKQKLEKDTYRNVPTYRIGSELHIAFPDAAILVSNNGKALHRALDTGLDSEPRNLARLPALAEARKLLPADSLASFWVNMEAVRQSARAREILTLPRNDQNLTVLFGSYLDPLSRASFVTGGLARDREGLLATVRMPSGRDGSTVELETHVAPAADPAALPLLEPRGVLFSSSFFMDLSKFWENRAQLFNEKQRKAFETFDENSGRFLAGNRFSQLLGQAGGYHRLVVVNQDKIGYETIPGQRFPSFAWVVSLRKPDEFGRNMEAILRGAALLGGIQFQLKLIEEKVGDTQLVGYRFSETAKVRNDPNNIRFNFSPCFARVGDQFLFCSTLELGRELVGSLQDQMKARPMPGGTRSVLFAGGLAELLRVGEDQLLAQTILDQALDPQEARQQVQKFIDLVRTMGNLELESEYAANQFRYDIRWRVSQQTSSK